MASFSPSPAPRRSSRLRQTTHSPPPRRSRLGNGSRFATPLRTTESFNESVASVPMEVEQDEQSIVSTGSRQSSEIIYALLDQVKVTFYSNLPMEVSHVLKHADFYQEPYTGDVDTTTGFALVASLQTCFVWQHAQALKGVPTCYIFACPQSHHGIPPLHCLVPYGAGREPGLILLSSSGEARVWDSIGIGLAGGSHYSTIQLDIPMDEIVTTFVRADFQTYVVSTSSGTLFRLLFSSVGGKPHLTYRKFARPSASLTLASLLPSFITGPSQPTAVVNPEPGNINSVAMGAVDAEGRDVWALVDSRVQRWKMKTEGWEDALMDVDVLDAIRSKMRDILGHSIPQDDSALDLELVDMSTETGTIGADKIVILTSYATQETHDVMNMDLPPVRRCYSLAHLSFTAGTFLVDRVARVPYQSTSASGAPMHPRIQTLLGGQVLGIQFGDAIALCSRDSDYSDRLELKSNTDRTLGVGASPSDTTIVIMTAATVMKATVDLDAVLNFDRKTGHATLIKSTIVQAILYGSNPANPLHFSLPPDLNEESLMRGTEQLSRAILESDSQIVRGNHDLHAQLTSRQEKLEWLIRFVNDNAALGKLSQRTRQQLAVDAEKLFACHRLWSQHNDLLASGVTHSVLNDAVYAYSCETRDPRHDDFLRAFFRHQVADIGLVVTKIPDQTVRASQETGRAIIDLLPEANRIVLTVLGSALEFREHNARVYGLELPMFDAWTSSRSMTSLVYTLFTTTAEKVDSAGRQIQSTEEPHSQLPELAGILFACFQERLDYLEFASDSDPSLERERVEVAENFALRRPEILETLRRLGHETAAFTLVEKYHDFANLVVLCNKGAVFPPENNPHAGRIQEYLVRFKQEFANELFRWYIQHGELRVMFSQDALYKEFMDQYFVENPNPGVSWIHSLGSERYGETASALLEESTKPTSMSAQTLILSLGKLAELSRAEDDDEDDTLDEFDRGLNFVSVQKDLLDQFSAVLAKLRGRQSLESQIDAVLKEKASKLEDRPALGTSFKNMVRDLLQGRVLSVEDVVDMLTMKDNENSVDDFETALLLLAEARDIPKKRRQSALRTLWRRIYIHDDWNKLRVTSNITDAEILSRRMDTALYHIVYSIHQAARPELLVTPDEALDPPSKGEVESRFAGLSPEQLRELMEDYDTERDKLGELDLLEEYDRICELVEASAVE